MDTAQILLLVVVGVLTILLVLLGLQVFFILKEFMRTIRKVNKVLDDTGVITESISAPMTDVSSLLTGLKTGVSLLNLFTKKKKKHEEAEEITNE